METPAIPVAPQASRLPLPNPPGFAPPSPPAGPYLLIPVPVGTGALRPPAGATAVEFGGALAWDWLRGHWPHIPAGRDELGLGARGGGGPCLRGQSLRAVAPVTGAGPVAPTWPVGVRHLPPVAVARWLEAPQGGQAGHLIALGALTAMLVLVHGTAPRGSDPPAHASFYAASAAAATAGLPGTLTLLGPGRGGHPWGRPGGAGPGAGRASRGLCPHAAPHPRLPL